MKVDGVAETLSIPESMGGRLEPLDLGVHPLRTGVGDPEDNSSTHKTQEVKAFLKKRPRIHLHFTPTSASWLNAVESWFSQLERRALYRGVSTSVQALRAEIRRFIEVHNEECAKPFVWKKSAKVIIDAVERVVAQGSVAN